MFHDTKSVVKFVIEPLPDELRGATFKAESFAGQMFWRMQGCQRRAAASVPCQACRHLLWKRLGTQCGILRLSGRNRPRYACLTLLGSPAHPEASDTAPQGYPCRAQM